MDDIRISVALVTRNRPESLRKTLASLRADAGDHPAEIVLSDDSNQEDAVGANRDIAREFDCRYIQGPGRGLYANRNHVALACLGSHIRTMDDDHTFDPGHWAGTVEYVRGDPEAVWNIGEYQTGGMEVLGPYYPGQLNARGFSVKPDDLDDTWALSDGAVILPRGIFDAGIRYCEQYRFGSLYLEFGSRLRALGYRLRVMPDVFVRHAYDPANRSYMNAVMEMQASLFACYCHACAYQPGLLNRLRFASFYLRQVLRHSAEARTAVQDARQWLQTAYRNG